MKDRHWEAALHAALAAAQEAEVVLVPQEFLGRHPSFAPLEFSWGLPLQGGQGRTAFCASKDDVHRLAPDWRRSCGTRVQRYLWANEVFVVGAAFDWEDCIKEEGKEHLGLWFMRLREADQGIARRRRQWRRANPSSGAPAKGPRVLVVGASGMGNVGDDLLAQMLADGLFAAGASQVWLSGPDVDPADLAAVDAVVVGGGGLVYAARRAGANEWQNLGNYLRFGPMACYAGIPCALIAVGDQDHGQGISSSSLVQTFARNCLAHFEPVTTRDASSSELLCGLGAQAETGSDLIFAAWERIRRAPRPHLAGSSRIALAGELFDQPAMRALLEDQALLREVASEREYELFVMSNDDLPHVHRARSALRAAGAGVSIVDGRGLGIEALAYLFGGWSGLLTTRFHGLVLAALTNVPVLALDVPDGKKARLIVTERLAPSMLITPEDSLADAHATLCRAMQGQLSPVNSSVTAQLAADACVHLHALGSLVARASAQRTQPIVPMSSTPISLTPSRSYRTDVAFPSEEGGAIGLCWAASTEATSGFGNLGDSLSAVMVSALSGRAVQHVNFDEDRTKLVAVGSIGHAIKGGEAVVWGCGVSVRGAALVENVPQTRYDVRAIRGPISAQHLRNLGVEVPSVYGDPVWLLPSIFNEPIEKKYELGVIPHIQDIEGFGPEARPPADSKRYIVDPADASAVTVINTWHEPTWEGLLDSLRRMLQCKRILSQSFHGVVIAEAYGIPVLNFRQLPGTKTGHLRVDLTQPCATDPRIFEFFAGGPRPYFDMYAQRRTERSDWETIIRTIDSVWEPFEYDPTALVEAFPLPLAYDPLSEQLSSAEHLAHLRF